MSLGLLEEVKLRLLLTFDTEWSDPSLYQYLRGEILRCTLRRGLGGLKSRNEDGGEVVPEVKFLYRNYLSFCAL
jgi:hypothetical protein